MRIIVYLLVIGVSAVVTFGLAILIYRLSHRFRLYPKIRERDVHTVPIEREQLLAWMEAWPEITFQLLRVLARRANGAGPPRHPGRSAYRPARQRYGWDLCSAWNLLNGPSGSAEAQRCRTRRF